VSDAGSGLVLSRGVVAVRGKAQGSLADRPASLGPGLSSPYAAEAMRESGRASSDAGPFGVINLAATKDIAPMTVQYKRVCTLRSSAVFRKIALDCDCKRWPLLPLPH
jgi:hypothetical protein